MNAAVRIDPKTGLKVFNTRAAKASEKITGKGYSVLTDQKMKELPEMPPLRSSQLGPPPSQRGPVPGTDSYRADSRKLRTT